MKITTNQNQAETLEAISKYDSQYRAFAYSVCGDYSVADDLVQEMYLRVIRNPKPYLTKSYILSTIKSIFLNSLTTEKPTLPLDSLYDELEDTRSTYEPTDEEQELLDRVDSLEWWQRELIEELYDKSYREIGDHLNTNYGFIFREVKKILGILLDGDMSKHNNSNLKNKK